MPEPTRAYTDIDYESFPAARRAVTEAIAQLRQDYRGWRNPYPASLEWDPEPA